MDNLLMTPAPDERSLRFVGDRVRFTLKAPTALPKGWRALLRTNLGKAGRLREEIVKTHAGKNPLSVAFWRDVPLTEQLDGEWAIELPMTDVGFFSAKAYVIDPQGRQYWPDGGNAGISVHPSSYRTANTIYCAFPRMFGDSKTKRVTISPEMDKKLSELDEKGYTVIPPSGTFRDLKRALPHIMDTLGCRILHLLPVGPTPTTFARFGRFGSPYACEDLIGIDPALVEFDKKHTGVEQFCELTTAVHEKGGRVLLDIVINHTGWGSRLYEDHPEWFLRHDDGTFASPGAWGVEWGDLVELNPAHIELWEDLANAFLTWCRRGVDGFRCDAGYKVPVQVWQYIEARVRREFPETLFLLEGLGGALEATEALLTSGGMQWAYSELFQNYSGEEVARYLDYAHRQSERVGVYVHYSETHDNNRLAEKSRVWSLMRNRLSALASVAGGYGFTCGVEWLAAEKVNVHSSRGLSWGSTDNLLPELTTLNRLMATHPCFFDGAKLTRLSAVDSDVYALRRESAEGCDTVLVLVNTNSEKAATIALKVEEFEKLGRPQLDLLGQNSPRTESTREQIRFQLAPGAAYCLATSETPKGLSGDEYRRARAQASWAIRAMSKVLLPEEIGVCSWRELAQRVQRDPRGFLGALAAMDRNVSRTDLLGALDAVKETYPQVVEWSKIDQLRITPVPPRHWLLVRHDKPFRATLQNELAESIEVDGGFVACFSPRHVETFTDATLHLGAESATIRFLAPTPSFPETFDKVPADSVVLLTNGRGGMARLRVDLGTIRSKYDCALGANLHPDLPVDRHVLVKRVRAWITADGFTTALNLQNLRSFQPGPPAIWRFVADAGDSRTVDLQLVVDMQEGANTTVFTFARVHGTHPEDLPPRFHVSITVRVDIEDRSFHSETHRNSGAEYHFNSNTRALNNGIGFEFTPAADRRLSVSSNLGVYHAESEWCDNIPHPIESNRGQVAAGDAFSPGWFELPLVGEEAVVKLTAEPNSPAKAAKVQNIKKADAFTDVLNRAVRAFVVKRGVGKTVIAGYPWFLDWGRDTFISARGMLTAGMVNEVTDLLTTFGRFVENGTMPNTIHGENASNRDTSDASLWYGVVCEETAALFGAKLYDTAVDKSGRTLAQVLGEIARGYATGTPNGIRMDSASGLIWSPAHFTWMDTNYPMGTPREGYPVEIQVLWIRLLRQVERLGLTSPVESWKILADRAEASLRQYFWIEDKGYIADLLIAKPGQSAADATVDHALRCNGLLGVAFGYFTGEQARRATEAAVRYLFIPGGIRTLAPLPTTPPLPVTSPDGHLLNDPVFPYWGRYEGDEDTRRKPAYHNGTAWMWPLPFACEALARAWDHSPAAVAAARAYLGSVDFYMTTNCLGQLPEIADGDAPHTPRGCDAQAWSVTETLRVWKSLA